MTKHNKQDGGPHTPITSKASNPAIILDAEKYRSAVVELDLSADQEREYIETVWAMLLQAMRLGIRLEFERDGSEAESCGQDAETPSPRPIPGDHGVGLKDKEFQLRFSDAATVKGVRHEY